MQDYTEKRDYPRMLMGCAARYQVKDTGESSIGILKDLSGGGLLIWVDKALAAGTLLNIEIRPVKAITPPMRAVVKVSRCDKLPAEENGEYAVACTIEQLLDRDEVSAQNQ